jgi:hypothetical protein
VSHQQFMKIAGQSGLLFIFRDEPAVEPKTIGPYLLTPRHGCRSTAVRIQVCGVATRAWFQRQRLT